MRSSRGRALLLASAVAIVTVLTQVAIASGHSHAAAAWAGACGQCAILAHAGAALPAAGCDARVGPGAPSWATPPAPLRPPSDDALTPTSRGPPAPS